MQCPLCETGHPATSASTVEETLRGLRRQAETLGLIDAVASIDRAVGLLRRGEQASGIAFRD